MAIPSRIRRRSVVLETPRPLVDATRSKRPAPKQHAVRLLAHGDGLDHGARAHINHRDRIYRLRDCCPEPARRLLDNLNRKVQGWVVHKANVIGVFSERSFE